MEICTQIIYCLVLFASTLALDEQFRLIREVVEKKSVLAKADPLAGQLIEINLWFNLLYIINLDERRQILTTSGWLDMWWDDPRFAWNASEYGGIDQIMVAQSKVWKPDIIVKNAVNNFNVVGSEDDNIKIYSSGYLEWSPGNIYETICEVDVSNFPFDSQTCYVNFSSWMYYDHQVHLIPYDKGVVLRHYKGNTEWSLEEMYYENAFYNFSDGYQNGMTITYKLKRHSTFYILKIMVPTVLLSLLNAFVFVVPVESGEKVSISVTTMLSLTVFLSYIGDVTPNNSDHIPVIALFVVLHLSLGALSIICNIITLNYHFKWRLDEKGETFKGKSFKRKSTIKQVFHILEDNDVDTAATNELNHNISEIPDMNDNNSQLENKTTLKFQYLDKIFFVVFILSSLSITIFALSSMLI